MYPEDIVPRWIDLPATTDHGMVIVTGNQLRHQRFALRLQKEFGAQVIAWYEINPDLGKSGAEELVSESTKRVARTLNLSRRVISYVRKRGIINTLEELMSAIAQRSYDKNHNATLDEAERKLFENEVAVLLKSAHLKPQRISSAFVHTPEFLAEIKQLDPYFFLTLGGPLYKKALLDSIRGVAINQHAGHSPEFKGSNTVGWALYHRSLRYISSTVHITVTGADAGPILRRSSPCIHADDDYFTIFCRVVALGTELMVETVQQILEEKKVICFNQPTDHGQTYLSKDFDKNVRQMILSDLTKNWLFKALYRQRNF